MSADVVIAVEVATRAHGGERVLQIAKWLVRRGLSVEFVALGEGTKPETAEFRAIAPVTVVDRFRRRGAARLPHLLGQRRLTTGWKKVRLSRWLAGRSHATFLLHDPLTASLLRYAPERPRRVVAALPNASWTLERARPEDRTTLATADGWIVSNAAQAAEVRAGFDGPVVELGSAESAAALIDRAELPTVSPAVHGPGVVVLLSPIGLWDAIDHAIEIAWRLHRAVPSLELRWVVDTDEDVWLARHDLDQSSLTDAVDVVSGSDPRALSDVSVVLRTGYEATHGELALAAGLAGVPVEGMCTSDLTSEAPEVRPFDVDQLVDDVRVLVADPVARAERGRALRAQLAHLDLEHHIDAVASLLAAERS